MFNIIYSIILPIIFSSLLSDEKTYNIKDFRSNPMGISQNEGFWRINLGTPAKSRIVSYADFNNDKYVDLIVVTQDESKSSETLLFYYYDYEQGFFKIDDHYSGLFKPFKDSKITNVLVTDINNDENFDLIITFDGKNYRTEFYIFNPSTQVFDNSEFKIYNSGIIVGDLNGDSKYFKLILVLIYYIMTIKIKLEKLYFLIKVVYHPLRILAGLLHQVENVQRLHYILILKSLLIILQHLLILMEIVRMILLSIMVKL